MPKITISEVDATKSTNYETLENVVYIPGFSNVLINPEAGEDSYIPVSNGVNGVGVGIPKLCTTLNQFYTYFGTSAAEFADSITYPTTGRKFADTAVTAGGVMFAEGDVDPSFFYAKSLLAQGIPVVYERMNIFTSTDIFPKNDNNPLGYITYQTGTTPPTTIGEGQTAPLLGQICILTQDNNAVWRCTSITDVSGTKTYAWKDMGIDATITEGTNKLSNVNDMTFTTIYEGMLARFTASEDNVLYDKNLFDIKYITSGGYPTFELNKTTAASDKSDIAVAAIDTATKRGDCIALIDFAKNKDRALIGTGSVQSAINGDYKLYSEFGAMFTPWIVYNGVAMPPSFAYLITLAEMVKTNPNWLACAGVSRGAVPGISDLFTKEKFTNAIANAYGDTSEEGKVAVNPITYIKPYGYVIHGNRTLADAQAATTKAGYYLNMRSLVSEVKKVAYTACQNLLFEQNSDILWVNFCSTIKPILEKMKATYGIAGYSIIQNQSSSEIKVSATIKIKPIYAVEEFEIEVYLTNEDITVEE